RQENTFPQSARPASSRLLGGGERSGRLLPVFPHGRKPSGLAGVRHSENELGVANCVAAFKGLNAAAAAQPAARIVPVLKKVFDPLKLKGTSLSPMGASLIVLWATVAAWQANSIAATVENVMRLD